MLGLLMRATAIALVLVVGFLVYLIYQEERPSPWPTTPSQTATTAPAQPATATPPLSPLASAPNAGAVTPPAAPPGAAGGNGTATAQGVAPPPAGAARRAARPVPGGGRRCECEFGRLARDRAAAAPPGPATRHRWRQRRAAPRRADHHLRHAPSPPALPAREPRRAVRPPPRLRLRPRRPRRRPPRPPDPRRADARHGGVEPARIASAQAGLPAPIPLIPPGPTANGNTPTNLGAPPTMPTGAAPDLPNTTPSGTHWMLASGNGGMSLGIDLGGGAVAHVVVAPQFGRLDRAGMDERVDWLRTSILARWGAAAGTYIYRRDGNIFKTRLVRIRIGRFLPSILSTSY